MSEKSAMDISNVGGGDPFALRAWTALFTDATLASTLVPLPWAFVHHLEVPPSLLLSPSFALRSMLYNNVIIMITSE